MFSAMQAITGSKMPTSNWLRKDQMGLREGSLMPRHPLRVGFEQIAQSAQRDQVHARAREFFAQAVDHHFNGFVLHIDLAGKHQVVQALLGNRLGPGRASRAASGRARVA